MSSPRRHQTPGIQSPSLKDTAGRVLLAIALLISVYLTAAPAWLVVVVLAAVFGGPELIAITITALTTLVTGKRRRK
jgi:hypothetical protein